MYHLSIKVLPTATKKKILLGDLSPLQENDHVQIDQITKTIDSLV